MTTSTSKAIIKKLDIKQAYLLKTANNLSICTFVPTESKI